MNEKDIKISKPLGVLNWTKIELLMKIGVLQDEDSYYFRYFEYTVTEELGLNPLEAFVLSYAKLIDMAENNKDKEVAKKIRRSKRKCTSTW